MIYLLYAGLRKRSDPRAAIAAAVVGAESLIFAANRFRCPLTTLAEQIWGRARFGDRHLFAEMVCPQFAGDPRAASRPGRAPASEERPRKPIGVSSCFQTAAIDV
jgi:hypothetical protein